MAVKQIFTGMSIRKMVYEWNS